MHLEENYPLKQLNTFGIDAMARYFASVQSIEDIISLRYSDIFQKHPHLILGGGSNILFTKTYPGLVVKVKLKGIRLIKEDDEFYYVEAAAGEDWHQFVLHTLEQGWYGLENLSLIPGNVGAAPIQNIGAYGVELKDVFHQLNFWSFEKNELQTFDTGSCQFEYRHSIFKQHLKGKGIITHVTFKLHKKASPNISYWALKNYFSEQNTAEITPKMVSDAVIEIRRSKLPDPEITGNAGSFFKNPVIPSKKLIELQAKFPDIPSYAIGTGHHKIPAAWLIEQQGWKGYIREHAGVHDQQALVLINKGGAMGDSIIQLARLIRDSVEHNFGISLEPEVNIV